MNNALNHLLSLLFGILIGGVIWLVSIPPRGQPVSLIPPPTPGPLVIHVAGEVAAGGVYELPPGSRVADAVDAAGGILPEGDETGLNLAEMLVDGQQVFVPGDADSPSPSAGQGPSGTRININSASSFQLQQLPGIGPSIAQRIIDYRDQNGAFEDTIDVVNVSGIGPATYDKIKDLITVDH